MGGKVITTNWWYFISIAVQHDVQIFSFFGGQICSILDWRIKQCQLNMRVISGSEDPNTLTKKFCIGDTSCGNDRNLKAVEKWCSFGQSFVILILLSCDSVLHSVVSVTGCLWSMRKRNALLMIQKWCSYSVAEVASQSAVNYIHEETAKLPWVWLQIPRTFSPRITFSSFQTLLHSRKWQRGTSRVAGKWK